MNQRINSFLKNARFSRFEAGLFVFTLCTLVVKSIARSYPMQVDTWYTDGFYNGVRRLFDLCTGWLPFPFIYVVVLGLVAFLTYRVLRWRAHKGWKLKTISVGKGLLKLLAILYVTFTWLWGFNYEKTSFKARHGLESASINDSLLFEDMQVLVDELAHVRILAALPDSTSYSDLPTDIDVSIRRSLEEGLIAMDYEPKGTLRAKRLYPKGVLLRISTAGVFLPFSGEGHVDAGLHPLQYPFVMAHEMSHAQGFTDEGVCNFIAYYVLSRSSDPLLKYTGLLGYFRYVASQCRRSDSKRYSRLFQDFPSAIVSDLQQISANSRQYPDIMPRLRDFTYDQYLKSQGVQAGVKSYNQMVNIHYQWTSKYGAIYRYASKD